MDDMNFVPDGYCGLYCPACPCPDLEAFKNDPRYPYHVVFCW